MKNLLKASVVIASATVLGIALLASLNAGSQMQPSIEEFKAKAIGQGRQVGQAFGVDLFIHVYSPPFEHLILLDAFKEAGNEGLVTALSKMSPKGRLMILGLSNGRLGYDVTYIRSLPTPSGMKIQVVTDRPIKYQALASPPEFRSTDYLLAALELDLSNQKGKDKGTLFVASRFQIGTDGELEFLDPRNTYSPLNPWTLVDIIDSNKK
jgi:hypothetical protein